MRFEEELALLLDIRKEGIWIKSEQEKEVTVSILNVLKQEGVDVVYDFEPSSGVYKIFNDDKNNVMGEMAKISTDDSSSMVYVLPTDEELMIARDTLFFLHQNG